MYIWNYCLGYSLFVLPKCMESSTGQVLAVLDAPWIQHKSPNPSFELICKLQKSDLLIKNSTALPFLYLQSTVFATSNLWNLFLLLHLISSNSCIFCSPVLWFYQTACFTSVLCAILSEFLFCILYRDLYDMKVVSIWIRFCFSPNRKCFY